MPKLNLPQKKMTIDVEAGANLMNALLSAGLPVASSCHGDGICSMCRVKIEGLAAPPADFEVETLRRNKAQPDERLSCQVSVESDLTVSTKYW
jgi:2Fe-2S ferredoxin